MNEIPEKFLEMLNYAEEILETDEHSPMAIILATEKGELLGLPISDHMDEDRFLQSLAEHGSPRISYGLCKWRNGNIDIPSANLRKGLEKLDIAYLETKFLLQGGRGFQLRSIKEMRPLKV